MYETEGKIKTIGNPILRKIGDPVSVFDSKLKVLFSSMHSVMRNADGIGLAAQQIGLALKCCVVDISSCQKDPRDFCILNDQFIEPSKISPLFICNPKITRIEGSSRFKEGCLSIPSFQFDVVRPEEITVQFQDCEGNQQEITCNGILARCMQHEFDHLNGILFTDLISKQGKKKLERFLENNNLN